MLLSTVAFLIAVLNGKIDSLAENIYEVLMCPFQEFMARLITLIVVLPTSPRCCV